MRHRWLIILLLVGTLGGLTACGVRDAIPADASHPLLWFVGLSAGLALLSASAWMLEGVWRRHSRRDERRDDRADRGAQPKS